MRERDKYLQDKSLLRGQPKRAIADYVESHRILVPRRFETLEEAKKSGCNILLRSEHEQEYDGVSGLLDSFELSSESYKIQNAESLDEVRETYFRIRCKDKIDYPTHKQYCDFLGLDAAMFEEQTSFSLWELLGGYNRTVIADSAIAGRYHIMTKTDNVASNKLFNYTIADSGGITQEYVMSLPDDLKKALPLLLETYEHIRSLGNFDPEHCPIMEFQTVDDKNYFLQYHRTQNFSPTTFSLERTPEKGEMEVPFVRGATTEEGIDARIIVHYAAERDFKFNLQGTEDGAYDFHYCMVFSELMMKKRKVQLTKSDKLHNFDWRLFEVVVVHLSRSKLFVPQLSVIHDLDEMLTKEDLESISNSREKQEDYAINYHITSDGKRAFLCRI